jgi:signal peptidase II
MRTIFWAGFVAFLTDQISKYWIVHVLELSRVRSIDVMPPLLNLRYGENRGINFGLFSDGSDASRWLLIALALVICVAVLYWARRNPMGRGAQISAGLLVGGALANVVDRLIYGYVLDFLNNSCCGFTNPFVYNIADVFIFAGAIGLIVFSEDGKAPRRKSAAKKGK